MFGVILPKWLENVLDYGITEEEFWNMSFAELERALASKRRIIKQQERQKASFDYILADLIGRSMARLYSSSNEMPKINDIYPSLFSEIEVSEKQKERKNELSALRFRKFAAAFKPKTSEVAKEE